MPPHNQPMPTNASLFQLGLHQSFNNLLGITSPPAT